MYVEWSLLQMGPGKFMVKTPAKVWNAKPWPRILTLGSFQPWIAA